MRKHKFGKAFLDEVSKVGFKYKHFNRGRFDEWQQSLIGGVANTQSATKLISPWRKLIYMVAPVLFFSLLLLRLFDLQIVKGNENLELADSNRIKIKVIHAPRGVIYDRNGKILAQNEPGFRLVESTNSSTNVSYISRDEVLKMEVEGDSRFQDLEIDSIRSYPEREVLAHVLGYVSEISLDELKDLQFSSYRLGDKIGRGGVEQSYEKMLKGVDGGEIVEVDASGNVVRSLRKKDPISGQNLYLTIDADLQKIAYEKLKEGMEKVQACCGALVAQDPITGQIIAMVSIPSFDPTNVKAYLTSSDSPILNRVIGGVYPPGSTFKIATALAGLESGKITKDTYYEDTGYVDLGPYRFRNWFFTQYGKTEGYVNIIKALQRSNDTFFYRMSQQVGEEIIGSTAKKLGMGKKLGIDIPGEVSGVIPDDNWKRASIGEVWYPGDTLHMSIGQGFVLATPLQISNLISTIAAGGKQYPPHLGLKVTSIYDKLVKEFMYEPKDGTSQIKQEDIEIIKTGLGQVTKVGGTAWPFFNFPINTAGKTGTAEFGDPKNKTHAWYTSYGPIDGPSIAVTVLVEGGGEGSSVAAPVAKEVLRWYFSTDKTNLIKDER